MSIKSVFISTYQPRTFINVYIISLCLFKSITVLSLSTTSSSSIGIEMKRSPESTIAPLGDEVLFECELNLSPEHLEWRFSPFNSKKEKESLVYINEKMNGYNITTKNKISKLRIYVSEKTVGEYQCIVWFGVSAVASVPAKLILADISLNEQNGPQQNEVIKWDVHPGNSIIIRCGEVLSNPEPIWSFYRNDLPSTQQTIPSGALIISPITHQDSATYECSAVNSITGSVVKIPQKITVNVKESKYSYPSFLVPPLTTFSVQPGSTIILECPAVGNPVPKATWSRPEISLVNRGKAFGSDNRTKILPYGLEIHNVTKEDAGVYFCSIDNGVGQLALKVTLQVLEPPIIEFGPKGTLTNESYGLWLECLAKGSPEPTIYWMINGEDCWFDPLISSNGSKLFIKTVEKRHAGIVQCFARNDVGEATAWNLLQVSPKQISGEIDVPPLGAVPHSTKSNNDHTSRPPKKKHKRLMVPPSAPSVTRLSDESVMVRWSVPSNDGLPIQFFKVQHRVIGNAAKTIQRTQWMTSNDDIPPHVRSYEVDSLKPDLYYRFRIAAVYSNNDNQLGNVSQRFLLQRASQLGPAKSHLDVPKLETIEPISETAIVIHWTFPSSPTVLVDGFYVYYRPASTAGEYNKATVDGMEARSFRIDHLEPGTSYEFKLQSFTSSAASDFNAILTGKTLKPVTVPPLITPSVVLASESTTKNASLLTYALPGGVGAVMILILLICICFCIKKRKNSSRDDDDIAENKSHHPDHTPGDENGFSPVGGNGDGRGLSSPHHKRNGIAPRMNIIPNPLAQDAGGGEKNRNMMELRFLPTTGGNNSGAAIAAGGGGIIGGGSGLILQPNNNCPTPDSHRRTLERTLRNQQQSLPPLNGGRRSRRSSGSGPGSPRIMGGISSELLHHNRSPIPTRAAHSNKQRTTRLGNRNENMSSGSLNSIEV